MTTKHKSFLTISTSWKNWELGIFKMCMASAGIIAGALFHEFFSGLTWLMVLIFVISGSYLFMRWFGQLISKAKSPERSE